MRNFFGGTMEPRTKDCKPKFDTDNTFFTSVKKVCKTSNDHPIKPTINDNGEYNITALHNEVLTRLKTISTNRIDNDKDIKIQKWISENNPDPTERRLAQERLFSIQNNLNSKDMKTEYEKRAEVIIQKYKDLCTVPIVIDFMKRTRTIDNEIALKKKQIAQEFISLCQEYVPIYLSSKLDASEICCDNSSIIYEDGSYFCSSCGLIAKTLDQVGAYKDTKRVSSNTRQKYYNVKHFDATTKKVQGIHKKEIPDYVYQECDNFCMRRKIDKDDFTIHDLNYVLNLNKELSNYYKDIHLIYREYTGKQVIDLSDVMDTLVEKYIEQDKLSDEIKLKDDSKNSINATYMCCRLSQISGRTDLRMELFFCTKTAETIKKYDEVIEARFRRLGWLLEGEKFEDVCK